MISSLFKIQISFFHLLYKSSPRGASSSAASIAGHALPPRVTSDDSSGDKKDEVNKSKTKNKESGKKKETEKQKKPKSETKSKKRKAEEEDDDDAENETVPLMGGNDDDEDDDDESGMLGSHVPEDLRSSGVSKKPAAKTQRGKKPAAHVRKRGAENKD